MSCVTTFSPFFSDRSYKLGSDPDAVVVPRGNMMWASDQTFQGKRYIGLERMTGLGRAMHYLVCVPDPVPEPSFGNGGSEPPAGPAGFGEDPSRPGVQIGISPDKFPPGDGPPPVPPVLLCGEWKHDAFPYMDAAGMKYRTTLAPVPGCWGDLLTGKTSITIVLPQLEAGVNDSDAFNFGADFRRAWWDIVAPQVMGQAYELTFYPDHAPLNCQDEWVYTGFDLPGGAIADTYAVGYFPAVDNYVLDIGAFLTFHGPLGVPTSPIHPWNINNCINGINTLGGGAGLLRNMLDWGFSDGQWLAAMPSMAMFHFDPVNGCVMNCRLFPSWHVAPDGLGGFENLNWASLGVRFRGTVPDSDEFDVEIRPNVTTTNDNWDVIWSTGSPINGPAGFFSFDVQSNLSHAPAMALLA